MADLKGRRVLIGTPAHDGRVQCQFAHSLVSTIRLCVQEGIDAREMFIANDSVGVARNDLAAMVFHGSYDDLIFIDSDQDWQPEWIIRLLSYDVDVVGAPICKRDDVEQYNVKTRTGQILKHRDYDILTAADLALGTGLIRYSRKAVQTLWNLSEKYVSTKGVLTGWIFAAGPRHGELMGEDTAACERLRASGILTWVDPSMNPGHFGTKRWQGDFSGWLMRKAAEHDNASNS